MDTPPKWFRIKELEQMSGVDRRTIHFYLREGLLPPPKKTGRTMAYYHEGHLRRLLLIREARAADEPLFAIRERFLAMGPAGPEGEGVSSRPRPRSAQGEKTREALLDSGQRVFLEKGYKATNVSDITRGLKVGKGTFYFYFSDKKALFLECAPRIFEALFSEGWTHISRERDPLRRLWFRCRATLPVLREFTAVLALIREAMDDPDDTLRALGHNIWNSVRAPLEADIRAGAESGIFRKVDPRMYASLIIGGLEGLTRELDREADPEAMAHTVYEWFATGVLSESGRKTKQ